MTLAGDVQPADVVILDRVICCYPDMTPLVTMSADRVSAPSQASAASD